MSEQAHTLSPTLAMNEAVRLRQSRGEQVVHLAFGEAGLAVHPLLRDALQHASSANAYGPVAGSAGLRASVAGYYSRRALATEPSQVVVGPGSKALLYALLLVLDGDLVLPRPSWVSYEPQARLLGKDVLRVDIPAAAGGVPVPDALRSEVVQARDRGLDLGEFQEVTAVPRKRRKAPGKRVLNGPVTPQEQALFRLLSGHYVPSAVSSTHPRSRWLHPRARV